MAGSHIPAATPNKRLYNGGSEWQDDIDGLADYYSTFYREYDAVIGRFNGVDPVAAMVDELSTYVYSSNNPIMLNDPLGDISGGRYSQADVDLFNAILNWHNRYEVEKMSAGMQNSYSIWHSTNYLSPWSWDGGIGGNGGGPRGGGGVLNISSPQQHPADRVEWLRRFTAVSLTESGKGKYFTDDEILMFAWVYVERSIKNGGLEEGFSGSSAYADKSPDYRMFMLGLGSSEFENDPIAQRDLKNYPELSQRALKIMVKIFFSFTFGENPLPEGSRLTGQGYVNDINGLHGDKDYYNKKVRQYIYLCRIGVIKDANTVLLLRGNNASHSDATFFYDEEAIRKYFDKNPQMIKVAPLYDPVTNTFY